SGPVGAPRPARESGDGGLARGPEADRRTRVTVLVALAANIVIAGAKGVGGLLSGSPALLSEAAPPRGGV
ncbi:hypothetical protein ABZ371_30895, partial [Streptomyces sp. NPDC005899]